MIVTGLISDVTSEDDVEVIESILNAIGSVASIRIFINVECSATATFYELACAEDTFYILLAIALHRPRDITIELIPQENENDNLWCMLNAALPLLECGIRCLRAGNVNFGPTISKFLRQQKEQQLQKAITEKDVHIKIRITRTLWSRLWNIAEGDKTHLEWEELANKIVQFAQGSVSRAAFTSRTWDGKRSSSAALLAHMDVNTPAELPEGEKFI